MSTIELTLVVALGCLAVALVITTVKLNRHEKYFNQIEHILGMIFVQLNKPEVEKMMAKAKEKVNG